MGKIKEKIRNEDRKGQRRKTKQNGIYQDEEEGLFIILTCVKRIRNHEKLGCDPRLDSVLKIPLNIRCRPCLC